MIKRIIIALFAFVFGSILTSILYDYYGVGVLATNMVIKVTFANVSGICLLIAILSEPKEEEDPYEKLDETVSSK